MQAVFHAQFDQVTQVRPVFGEQLFQRSLIALADEFQQMLGVGSRTGSVHDMVPPLQNPPKISAADS
jgi:hypothetical protein